MLVGLELKTHCAGINGNLLHLGDWAHKEEKEEEMSGRKNYLVLVNL